jgi:class 3 adenylate cyclase
MPACPSCEHETRLDAKFCDECGTPLLAERKPVDYERKVVTVFFCDLVGFTERSEILDPEDVRAFLLPYYDALTSEIERHGGTVDKFLGDGVMAVFGTPVAHEDDPERAVRTALRVLENVPNLGLDLHVRIGINTGEVLIATERFERGDAITGDAANTGSRLQAAAPVDGVIVGQRTYDVTSHLFGYEVLEPVRVKGKAHALPVFRPVAPISRIGTEGVETTPFVGRDFELETLTRLFERACTTPSTEFVTIVAEPGLGKSRLVRELARHVESAPELVVWRVGRCLPYGDGITFSALAEIIRSHAGILDDDDQAAASSKLDIVLTEPDPSIRAWMKDRLGPLVGLQTSAEPSQQEETFSAWRRFLEMVAKDRPTVIVVEDLHWADDALVSFLQHVAERTTGLPVLLITTARPEIDERHPGWLGRSRHSTVLPLAALNEHDIGLLIENVVADASPEFVAAVLERAGGSPLYAEQLSAMLREQATPIGGPMVDDQSIPPTIQALLTARIDALPSEHKALLLDASVIGKTFWSGAVETVSGMDQSSLNVCLNDLARREFLRPVFPSTMAGDDEFTFWHALVRDVAYGQLPRSARMRKHQAAATWIESRAGDHIEDFADILAHHCTTALEMAGAIGSEDQEVLRASAARFLALAGERLHEVDTEGAALRLARALDLMEVEAVQRPRLLALMGEVELYRAHPTEAARYLEASVPALRDHGDATVAGRAMTQLSFALNRLGDPRSRDVLADAISILETVPGPELFLALNSAAIMAMSAGNVGQALATTERATELGSAIGQEMPSMLLGTKGEARLRLGDVGALEDMRAAVQVAVERNDGFGAAVCYNNLGNAVALYEGPSAALEIYQAGQAWSEERGVRDAALFNRGGACSSHFEMGNIDVAMASAVALEQEAEAHGSPFPLMDPRLVQVHIATLCGQVQQVLHVVPWLETFPFGTLQGEAIVQCVAAAVGARAASGASDRARELLRTLEGLDGVKADATWARDLARLVRSALSVGDRGIGHRLVAGFDPVSPYGAHALVTATAALCETDGDIERAAEHYAEAAHRWEHFGVIPEQAHAMLGHGRCLVALSRPVEAAPVLERARHLFTQLKAAPALKETTELLQRSVSTTS